MMYIDKRTAEEVTAQLAYELDNLLNGLWQPQKEINRTDARDLDGEPFQVHTCEVSDRPYIYETAFASKKYNDGDWIIIDHCDDPQIAEIKHKMWVEYFITNAPNHITDDWSTVVYLRDE